MRKRRENTDIFADVLRSADAGASKTKLMFCANLNHELLENYLETATEQGFFSSKTGILFCLKRDAGFLKVMTILKRKT